MRFLLTCFLALYLTASMAAEEALLLPWTERKPFQYLDEKGQLAGILYDLGERIFGKAGIEHKWADIPANRILLSLSANEQKLCLVGWFKTPEREKMARISLPIYRDKPLRGVLAINHPLKAGASLDSIFANLALKILVKQSYSYGAQMDQRLAARQGTGIERVVIDNARMLLMIGAQRADITFMPQEEIDFHAATTPNFARDFKVIDFDELPAGNTRHVICSLQVSDETMQRIDATIRASIQVK